MPSPRLERHSGEIARFMHRARHDASPGRTRFAARQPVLTWSRPPESKANDFIPPSVLTRRRRS